MTVLCRYYKFRGVAYPDLVQEGTFGLIKAVDKYDPDRGWYKIIDSTSTIEYANSQRLLGFRFSTYASWWIKQSVSRSIAEKSRIIRLPVHIHDMMVSMRLKWHGEVIFLNAFMHVMFSGEHYEGGEVISESIRTQAELPRALGAPGPARSKGRATRQVLQRSKILLT